MVGKIAYVAEKEENISYGILCTVKDFTICYIGLEKSETLLK